MSSSRNPRTTLWPDPFLATIGVFDGIHRGHQEILRLLREESARRRLPSVLVTFDHRPVTLLRPGMREELLTPPPRKWRLVAELGIDRVVVLRFTSAFSELGPRVFLERFLGAGRGLAGLWVGSDFRFGHQRAGDVGFLAGCSRALGFSFTPVDPVIEGNEPISSSRIRKLLCSGDINGACRLLGRWPDLEGVVVRGRGEGARDLVPTANLSLPRGTCLPAGGVYAGYAEWSGLWHPAVLNVGRRPTVTHDSAVVPEVHVLDLEADLLGRRLLFQFRGRLREERKFPSSNELLLQIRRDIEAARSMLDEPVAVDSHLAPEGNSC